MGTVAVIGSGISGLAAAWLLSRRHEVTLFEKEDRPGGHTHTHDVGGVAIDSGFIVHNEVNYPLLCRMLRELNVPTVDSDMSFGVSSRPSGLTWCSRGLNGLFAQRKNMFRPAFYALLREIDRFNRTAPGLLQERDAEQWTLGTWLNRERFTNEFREEYLVPMAAAVWSTSPRDMMTFPASTLIRFFQNHGFLGFRTQHRWRTIPGGCSRYIGPLTGPLRDRVRLGRGVKRIERTAREVIVRTEGHPSEAFDEVVVACHGDEILPLLAAPAQAEREVLGAFTTNANDAVLHTDASILPPKRRAWASWNHLRVAGADSRLVVTYHMNRLQPLQTRTDYFVSLNAGDLVREDKVLKRMTYRHPRYTLDAIKAQGRWQDVSGRNRTHYCGAYWGYGFHEDGVRSAVRVAQRMGIEW